MKIIKLTNTRKYTLVDNEDFERLNKYKNSTINWWGYVVRRTSVKEGKKDIFIHREILNISKGEYVDHINSDKLDNRKENLRLATYQQNNYNRRLNKNNKSGYKGVIWDKGVKKWRAYIRSGKMIYLGVFKTKLEAAKTYNEAAIKLFKEFAKLNKI